MREALADWERLEDPLHFTLVGHEQGPLGMASFMRIAPEFGVIEIGRIWFGPALQRTAAATEAIFLLARRAFEELGYRRLEWKCDALNAPSRRAAERFGFTFEGIFRKHMVVKGRSRDTAWFAITDDEWPEISRGFRAWLADANFDAHGGQRARLAELIRAARGAPTRRRRSCRRADPRRGGARGLPRAGRRRRGARRRAVLVGGARRARSRSPRSSPRRPAACCSRATPTTASSAC